MLDSVVLELGQVTIARRYNCYYQGICPRLGLRLKTLSRISRMKQDLQRGTAGTKMYQEKKGVCMSTGHGSSIIRKRHQGRE